MACSYPTHYSPPEYRGLRRGHDVPILQIYVHISPSASAGFGQGQREGGGSSGVRCFIAARREDLMGLGPLGLGQPSGELEMVGGIMVWSQNHCDGGGGNTGFGSGSGFGSGFGCGCKWWCPASVALRESGRLALSCHPGYILHARTRGLGNIMPPRLTRPVGQASEKSARHLWLRFWIPGKLWL